MLSEYQIKEKRKLLVRKRRELIRADHKFKKGSVQWHKNNSELSKVRGEIKSIDSILRGRRLDYKPLKKQKNSISIQQQMKMVRPLVRSVLRTDMDARDDDRLLYIRVWELQGSKPNMLYKSFQDKLILGKFATPESVSRTRRSLQERNISLRGKLYEERHKAEQMYKNQYSLSFE